MRRELKIRIWDNQQGVYLEGITDLYSCMFNDGEYYQIVSNVYDNKKRYKIEQFTGVQDSSGLDIYEGDETDEGVVVWIDGLHWEGGGSKHPGFYYENKHYEGDMDYHKRLDDTCTVISKGPR